MAEENFVPVGPGIERLAEECELLFPDARTVVLSSDSVENELQLVEKIKGILFITLLNFLGMHFGRLLYMKICPLSLCPLLLHWF